MFNLKTYSRYQVPMPVDGDNTPISDEAIEKIISRINSLYRGEINNHKDLSFYTGPGLVLEDFPRSWSWKWKVTGKAAFVGTLPKRISSFFLRKFDLSMPNYLICDIGNIVAEERVSNELYNLEIWGEPEWEDGDFGDEGSCFFRKDGEYRDDRLEYYNEMGLHAIVFYDANGFGIGRVLALPVTHLEDEAWLLFNAYGLSRYEMTRTFCQLSGMTYHKVSACEGIRICRKESAQSWHSIKDKDRGYIWDQISYVYLNTGDYILVSSPREVDKYKSEDGEFYKEDIDGMYELKYGREDNVYETFNYRYRPTY